MGNDQRPTIKPSDTFSDEKKEKENEDNKPVKQENIFSLAQNMIKTLKKMVLVINQNFTETNIFVYSNKNVDKSIENLIYYFNNPIFDCRTMIIEGEFSKENSNIIISKYKGNYNQQNNKNILIIPINSISDFKKIIESDEEKNILAHFNNSLTPEQQPFFFFIDSDYTNVDFNINDYTVKKNFVLERYYQLKRLEIDFEIYFDIVIKGKDKTKIEILKNLLLQKKKNLDDFRITINQIFIYQNLFGEEIEELETFLENIFVDSNTTNTFRISLVLINQNSDFIKELREYEKLEKEIVNVKFSYYYLKKENIKQLLSNFPQLDERNFSVKRIIKSPKYDLLKLTSFYNNKFEDILYCNQISFYPYKLNIGIWGFSKSGKSTLMNAILNEKKCIESILSNNRNNSICQYILKEISKDSLKDYPINFIEFPGFNRAKNNFDNFFSEMKNQKDKIHILLFCLKYENILPDKEDYIKSILDILIKFNANVFFIVTQSKSCDSKEFKICKDKIINLFNKFKKINSFNSIFGQSLENRIIPILSLKKEFDGKIINSFGLDILFKQISNLFKSKEIKYDIIPKSDNKIKDLIRNNELLKIFESKESLINGLGLKMKIAASNFILQWFLFNPHYLNDISEISLDKICIIHDYVFNHFLIIYKPIIDKFDEKTKLTLYKISKENRDDIEELKNILKNKEFAEIKKELINIKELNKNPIIKLLSDKISKLIVDKFLNIISENFFDFFEYLIKTYNNAIYTLDELKQYFENIYSENNPKTNNGNTK